MSVFFSSVVRDFLCFIVLKSSGSTGFSACSECNVPLFSGNFPFCSCILLRSFPALPVCSALDISDGWGEGIMWIQDCTRCRPLRVCYQTFWALCCFCLTTLNSHLGQEFPWVDVESASTAASALNLSLLCANLQGFWTSLSSNWPDLMLCHWIVVVLWLYFHPV